MYFCSFHINPFAANGLDSHSVYDAVTTLPESPFLAALPGSWQLQTMCTKEKFSEEKSENVTT